MLLISYGTRPEWLKVKPVIEELKRRNLLFKTFFTGQHKNLVASEADFKMILHDSPNQNRLNHVLSSCLMMASFYFEENKDITHVMVQGDTTSALAIALAAFNCKRKIIHLEAGLRTYDKENPYPEESNRQLIARIADVHFCPTSISWFNLRNERINDEIHVVGNTALDNLVPYIDKCENGDVILVTLHRRENHDKIDVWFEMIEYLANDWPHLEFILPIHPNPNVQKHKGILKKVKVVEPLEHFALLEILVKCRGVITDSGGLQEECSFLKKPCLVLRKETERPEALGKTSLLVKEPLDIVGAFYGHIMVGGTNKINDDECPFGDGHSSEKIVDIIEELVYGKTV